MLSGFLFCKYWYDCLFDKDNGALSDGEHEFGGRPQKNSSTSGWSTTIYHLGVDRIEN